VVVATALVVTAGSGSQSPLTYTIERGGTR